MLSDAAVLARALNALNAVLVQARLIALQGMNGERASAAAELAAILDGAEYLPVLMLEPRDNSHTFRETLVGLAQRHEEFWAAVQRFDGRW